MVEETDDKFRQELARGSAALRVGRFDEALAAGEAALALAPGHAGANSLSGLALFKLGKSAEAEARLRKAIEIEPQQSAHRLTLSEFFEEQGATSTAVGVLLEFIAQAPTSARALERLGDLYSKAQTPEAVAAYGRAAMLEPNNVALVTKWAQGLAQMGRLNDAAKILDRVVRFAPSHEPALRLYCEVLEARGEWALLEQIAGQLSKLCPTEPLVWKAMSKASWETGRFRMAMERFRRAIEYSSRDAQTLATYGRLALQALHFDEAAAALSEAEAKAPSDLHALSGLALLHTVSGNFELAETYARRCLALDPEDVSAFKVLNQLKPGEFTEDELLTLSRLSQRQELRIEHRISATYAAADTYHARGRYDDAFASYQCANDLERQRSAAENLVYQPHQRSVEIGNIIAMFPAPVAQIQANASPCPIFVLGMPRSGTTLVESVLASHPHVFACGERGSLRMIMREYILAAKTSGSTGLSEQRYLDWAQAYFAELPDLGGATHITDKNPWNFDAIGLIPQLFPNAKIIHVRRGAIETCLSIFCNEFSKFQPFANSLEDIGHYYGEYARLMAHWERELGDRFTTVQYESFVADFEHESAALAGACGLDASQRDQAVKTDRPIATLSLVQVRQGVALKHSRAERYVAHTGTLVRALKRAGVDLATGGHATTSAG